MFLLNLIQFNDFLKHGFKGVHFCLGVFNLATWSLVSKYQTKATKSEVLH